MPAHCTAQQVENKVLGDGSPMTQLDRRMNDEADRLAKSTAREDRVPREQRQRVRERWARVTAIATWIGQVTVLANSFPEPGADPGTRQRSIRDSEGRRADVTGCAKRGKKRRPAPHCDATLHAADSLSHVASTAADATLQRIRRVRRRVAVVSAITPSAAAAYARRAAAGTCAGQRARSAAEVQVSNWLAGSFFLQAAPAPVHAPAADRMAAVRDRVRAREAGSSG